MGALGSFEISVRSLTKSGTKFQKSANIGSGRTATQQDVIDAIASVERVVVVDISFSKPDSLVWDWDGATAVWDQNKYLLTFENYKEM